MKVFVLMKCFSYEDCGEVESIYSTKELALKNRKPYPELEANASTWIDGDGSTYWIDEFEIDPD